MIGKNEIRIITWDRDFTWRIIEEKDFDVIYAVRDAIIRDAKRYLDAKKSIKEKPPEPSDKKR